MDSKQPSIASVRRETPSVDRTDALVSDNPVTNSPALFQTERQQAIADIVVATGRVEVSELSDQFGVTTETIRRDLSALQANRVAKRVHGGAVPWETSSNFEPLLSIRNDQQLAEKKRLARAALPYLPESGTIIIDSGSTTGLFAQFIPERELRIITNSLVTAQVLADRAAIRVIVLPGKLRKNTLAMVDTDTVAAVRPMAVSTLFISTDAATAANGLTTPYRSEAALKKAMIQAADRVIALIDFSKFGADKFIRFASWEDIDVLVTNRELEPEIVSLIQAAGTQVILS